MNASPADYQSQAFKGMSPGGSCNNWGARCVHKLPLERHWCPVVGQRKNMEMVPPGLPSFWVGGSQPLEVLNSKPDLQAAAFEVCI